VGIIEECATATNSYSAPGPPTRNKITAMLPSWNALKAINGLRADHISDILEVIQIQSPSRPEI
jgi:hypothetical protein